jgi:hypothetical protein
MTQSKSIFKSKTAYSANAALVISLLAIFDIEVEESMVDEVLHSMIAIAVFGFTLYSRIVAKTTIK